MKTRRLLLLLLVIAGGIGAYAYVNRRPSTLTLTGVITTNDVTVSPQVAGQIGQLLVKEGDQIKQGQLVAVITPDELRAETAYYAQNVEGLSSQVRESEAALRFQERQTADQIAQAQSTLAATEAQVKAATADLENAKLVYDRTQRLADQKVASAQELDQARTNFDAARAKMDALVRQVDAARCQPHEARHQDVRSPAAHRQHRSSSRGWNDGLRDAAPLSAMTAAIDVRRLVKKFGDFTAVKGITFGVEQGEIFGLLGPNGAGKSTLIRMLTTLLLPTEGTARVNGFDVIAQADDVRKSIGVIPQALTSDLEFSVEENLIIFAKLYGVPRAKRQRLIDELLAAVE